VIFFSLGATSNELNVVKSCNGIKDLLNTRGVAKAPSPTSTKGIHFISVGKVGRGWEVLWEGWVLKIETFLGCEMAMSKTHVHDITNVPILYGSWTK
jgi:hypothetical protein